MRLFERGALQLRSIQPMMNNLTADLHLDGSSLLVSVAPEDVDEGVAAMTAVNAGSGQVRERRSFKPMDNNRHVIIDMDQNKVGMENA